MKSWLRNVKTRNAAVGSFLYPYHNGFVRGSKKAISSRRFLMTTTVADG
jgi:hypothetical protein